METFKSQHDVHMLDMVVVTEREVDALGVGMSSLPSTSKRVKLEAAVDGESKTAAPTAIPAPSRRYTHIADMTAAKEGYTIGGDRDAPERRSIREKKADNPTTIPSTHSMLLPFRLAVPKMEITSGPPVSKKTVQSHRNSYIFPPDAPRFAGQNFSSLPDEHIKWLGRQIQAGFLNEWKIASQVKEAFAQFRPEIDIRPTILRSYLPTAHSDGYRLPEQAGGYRGWLFERLPAKRKQRLAEQIRQGELQDWVGLKDAFDLFCPAINISQESASQTYVYRIPTNAGKYAGEKITSIPSKGINWFADRLRKGGLQHVHGLREAFAQYLPRVDIAPSRVGKKKAKKMKRMSLLHAQAAESGVGINLVHPEPTPTASSAPLTRMPVPTINATFSAFFREPKDYLWPPSTRFANQPFTAADEHFLRTVASQVSKGHLTHWVGLVDAFLYWRHDIPIPHEPKNWIFPHSTSYAGKRVDEVPMVFLRKRLEMVAGNREVLRLCGGFLLACEWLLIGEGDMEKRKGELWHEKRIGELLREMARNENAAIDGGGVGGRNA
ncbi:hypothetical protein P280DRAFT_512224 [Massarina eburnea CBS 473.64]|uniref:Uncharacterized protein n=1 Tax=Massarina eburnea CBS 473.64 TaxID=1395130 RepID=A0A6A6SG59_9PLEO|nr:hypothetical protein P280DRAFT_512224 [Massarina eburnea CBS 473.64]